MGGGGSAWTSYELQFHSSEVCPGAGSWSNQETEYRGAKSQGLRAPRE